MLMLIFFYFFTNEFNTFKNKTTLRFYIYKKLLTVLLASIIKMRQMRFRNVDLELQMRIKNSLILLNKFVLDVNPRQLYFIILNLFANKNIQLIINKINLKNDLVSCRLMLLQRLLVRSWSSCPCPCPCRTWAAVAQVWRAQSCRSLKMWRPA